jgi:hypothetical protein
VRKRRRLVIHKTVPLRGWQDGIGVGLLAEDETALMVCTRNAPSLPVNDPQFLKYLFGAMHSLCIRVRKIRWRNDEEVCSSVPSMCSYVRGGGTSGTNSAGCGINEGGGLPPPKQLPYRLRTLLTLRK